jgi:hypothetical protein
LMAFCHATALLDSSFREAALPLKFTHCVFHMHCIL